LYFPIFNTTMATYKELQAQLAEITRQAEDARAAEIQAVIEDIRAKVAEFGLTEKDVFGRRRRGQPAKNVLTAAPKYQDPKTGAEWTGHGRAPAWIKDAKDRSKFLIVGATDGAASGAVAASKAKVAAKSGVVAKKAAGDNSTAVKKTAAKKALGAQKTPAKKAAAATKKIAGKKAASEKAGA
jgi:DNA-binding protein H-NS